MIVKVIKEQNNIPIGSKIHVRNETRKQYEGIWSIGNNLYFVRIDKENCKKI